MSPVDYTSIINTAVNQLPGILALIRANHAQANPGAPVLTDEDVAQGLAQALKDTLAKDDAWDASHPRSVALDEAGDPGEG